MLVKYLKSDADTVYKDVEDGKVTDKVGVTNPLCHFQVLNYVCLLYTSDKGICVRSPL